MTRRQKRKVVVIAVLMLLLVALGAYFSYFRATKRLTFDVVGGPQDILPAPQYMYSFSGTDADRMQRPLGVFVDDSANEVYVSDTGTRKIGVYTLDGELKRTFGGNESVVPLYIAKNPKDGNIYITDRRQRTIHIYTSAGKYLKDFDPKLPKSELPSFNTGGVQWAPIALAFGPDGTLYVTEILNGHRVLMFAPDGTFKKSVGTVGLVNDAKAAPKVFQFPNSIKVFDGQVYVSDSNNRRVQVFDKNLDFDRIIVTGGLPRGIDFLARSSDSTATSDKFVAVDTLAHDATIWSVKGDKIVNFGERGVLEGQFSYPNDVSVGPKNLIFITDTSNGRVQVWGWPEEVSPIPIPRIPAYWRWCLSPLLLLPLLLFLRRKRFFATADFVVALVTIDKLDQMPHRSRRWMVTQQDYEALKAITHDGVDLGDLLNPAEHSESDVRALMDRMDVDHDTAVLITLAQRAKVFCTEDPELRRLAKLLEIDAVSHEEFLERYAAGRGRSDDPTAQ